MTESRAKELGLVPLGYLRSYAFTAIDVWQDMLLGPAWSTPLALERAGLTMTDLTLIDMHEALPHKRWRIFSCWAANVLPAKCWVGRMPLARLMTVNLTCWVGLLPMDILSLLPVRE